MRSTVDWWRDNIRMVFGIRLVISPGQYVEFDIDLGYWHLMWTIWK